MLLFQFASNGLAQNSPSIGSVKLNTATMAMDKYITILYAMPNGKARRYAQIDIFNTATAIRLMICPMYM